MKKAIKDYLAKLHDNKKDKGFSLVELIIVIAIMAILVGVVASQVLPYIEKSRKSKDLEMLNNVSSDMITALADAMTDGKQLEPAAGTNGVESVKVTKSTIDTASSDLLKTALAKYDENKGQTANAGAELEKVAANLKSGDANNQFLITFDHKNKVIVVSGSDEAVTISVTGGKVSVTGGKSGLIVQSSIQ